MHNFKTSNNFSPKICCKNIVNVKNRIIISNWDLPQLEIKNIAKMLLHFVVFLGFFCVWYFVVLLDFFFSIVKLGEPKFTVSHIIFFCCIFTFFLMRNFKTNNNFSSKICCENAVDVKNKIIKYQTETYHSWK